MKEGSTTESVSNTDLDTMGEGEDQLSSGTETALPLDVIFDLLANERRRRVVRYLLAESESTTLGELAEHIAAIENDKPQSALSSTERKRVYISLYQGHLPKLDDAGAIEFDENRKTVEVGSTLDQLASYLPADESPTHDGQGSVEYHLAIPPVIGGIFIVQSYFFPNAWLSGLLIGIFLVSTASVSLNRIYRRRKSDSSEDSETDQN